VPKLRYRTGLVGGAPRPPCAAVHAAFMASLADGYAKVVGSEELVSS
jgi:hypothetical protein